MDKKTIQKYIRENTIGLEEAGKHPHIKGAIGAKTTDDVADENEYDKVTKLLSNDIFNHAAIVRQLKGEPWAGNSEATNRSLFRKKLKKLKNDEGGTYSFDESTVEEIQKILMNISSTINHSIGRQGK